MDTEENLDALLSALSDDEDEEGNDSFDDAICNLVDDEISKLEDTGSSNNVLNDSKTNENKIKTEEPKIRRNAEGKSLFCEIRIGIYLSFLCVSFPIDGIVFRHFKSKLLQAELKCLKTKPSIGKSMHKKDK